MKLQKYYETAGIPKLEPRKRTKGRKDRAEAKILHMVRMHDVARDGYCRVAKDWAGVIAPDPFWSCEGDSQLMHLENQRRFKTRGQNPALRHTTAGTCMGCAKHHDMYDGRRRPRLRVDLLTADGADGDLRWSLAR